MMRLIKFRVWDRKKRQMVVSDEWTISVRMGQAILNRDDLDLLQFTGFRDKNQKEIYEGDIIQDGTIKTIVEWDNAQARFYSKIPTSEAWVNCEVIGNIYQHPFKVKLK